MAATRSYSSWNRSHESETGSANGQRRRIPVAVLLSLSLPLVRLLTQHDSALVAENAKSDAVATQMMEGDATAAGRLALWTIVGSLGSLPTPSTGQRLHLQVMIYSSTQACRLFPLNSSRCILNISFNYLTITKQMFMAIYPGDTMTNQSGPRQETCRTRLRITA
ncbi:hypothetical protein FH972_025156 [Carpinus fangiana]|uniref:Uncharacterized protein n=1 Tax=Carpinus fangiana TaxID=176857 RepID=A0A5N6L068_9ROSI|nr:hypothetical protein FH972_025156 [Carpinus fangiana]